MPLNDEFSPKPLTFKESSGSEPPQFETAEYAGQSRVDTCSYCNQRIIDSYYRLNGRKACSTCTEQAKADRPKTNGNYFRALIFGIGAAILGPFLIKAEESQ
jgi:hypothetical protein